MTFPPRAPLARANRFLVLLGVLPIFACGSAPPGDAPEPVAQEKEGWDSQGGNPTHATHSYLTEFAIDQLKGEFPEVETFRATLVDGSNQEVHELPMTDPDLESLREAADGTNWSCNHPEVIWSMAQHAYEQGDKHRAYFLTGIILHWVEDMGVPAHAFHVVHQGTFALRDNFEVLALQRWAPRYDINERDPGQHAPSDYLAVSDAWTQNDFHSTFPGVTYTRTFFALSWFWASHRQAQFVEDRQGRTAAVTTWALRAAVTNF